jgi:hypothetical protein
MIGPNHRWNKLWPLLPTMLCTVVVLSVVGPALTGSVLADLPPRPKKEPKRESVRGGAIQLHIAGGRVGLWAVVQWQDGLGNWHDVEGWRGEPDEERTIWYVHERDFDTGPFRWALYDGPEGELLAASEPFDLPGWHGQIVHVDVSLGP